MLLEYFSLCVICLARDTSSVEKLQSEVLDDSQPSGLAETCLRDLLGRANFGNLKDTLSPILKYVE